MLCKVLGICHVTDALSLHPHVGACSWMSERENARHPEEERDVENKHEKKETVCQSMRKGEDEKKTEQEERIRVTSLIDIRRESG